MISEKSMRRRANRLGYKVEKGYQRYLMDGYPIVRNAAGEHFTGYNIIDLHTNFIVWPSTNGVCDHLLTLEDVAEFLQSVDQEHLFNW